MCLILREARLEDAFAIARVHVDTWRTTYRGIVPDDYLASLSYQKRESSWRQMLSTAAECQHFIYVAEEKTGQIIAFADGGPERTNNPIYKGAVPYTECLKANTPTVYCIQARTAIIPAVLKNYGFKTTLKEFK